MTDISILPQPVRDLVRKADKWKRGDRTWELIRADLLRAYAENAELREQLDYAGRLFDTAHSQREQAEAELERVRSAFPIPMPMTPPVPERWMRDGAGAAPAWADGWNAGWRQHNTAISIIIHPRSGDEDGAHT